MTSYTYAENDVEQLLANPAEEHIGHHAPLDPLIQVEEVADVPHADLVVLKTVGRKRILAAQLSRPIIVRIVM